LVEIAIDLLEESLASRPLALPAMTEGAMYGGGDDGLHDHSPLAWLIG